jgi:hypothetical protein
MAVEEAGDPPAGIQRRASSIHVAAGLEPSAEP